MQIRLATLTPTDPTRDISSWWMADPFLRKVDDKTTCLFLLSRLNLSQLAKQAKKRSTYVKHWLILDFLKLKPLFCTKTTSLVLRWAKIWCAEKDLFILTFVITLCMNSYWTASSNSCLCARTKWWLMPSTKVYRPGLSLSLGTTR